jgi:hypothetical protein
MVAMEYNRQLTSRWSGEPNLSCFVSMMLVAAQLRRYAALNLYLTWSKSPLAAESADELCTNHFF